VTHMELLWPFELTLSSFTRHTSPRRHSHVCRMRTQQNKLSSTTLKPYQPSRNSDMFIELQSRKVASSWSSMDVVMVKAQKGVWDDSGAH
jgi:hypothetical protein